MFFNNLKSEEVKSQIKVNLSFFPNSYFYNYKPSPRIDFIKKKPDKENGVVISNQKLYNKATQEIISDTSQFEKLNEDPTLKREASFYVSRNKKTF